MEERKLPTILIADGIKVGNRVYLATGGQKNSCLNNKKAYSKVLRKLEQLE